MSFSWQCPFCNKYATITDDNCGSGEYTFNFGNKYARQTVRTSVIACPNPACKEYQLGITLHDVSLQGNKSVTHQHKRIWHLIPESAAKIFPSYIPVPILNDYREACLIRDLSPKASATLSRRCLQGMIRDFWAVRGKRLFDEIEGIKDKVDPATWDAIDAVRKIGNIGAHMEEDINLIIDVEPNEAALLIDLIETLLRDWYIVREERKRRVEELIAAAKSKEEARKGAEQ